MALRSFVVAGTLAAAAAQDPAPGWVAYARGLSPTGKGRITYIEGYWTVPAAAKPSGAFYSPWFGIDTSDNLNLLQPVNPWVGNSWQIYNEYYQWDNGYNFNSQAHTVKAGDALFGSITFNPANETYTIFHKDLTDGWSVSTNIAVEKEKRGGGYKNYTISYFVFEKVARCADYPPNGEVTFTDISIFYDGVKAAAPVWTTGFVDAACGMKATVLNASSIQITWNTKAADPAPELLERDQGAAAQAARAQFGKPGNKARGLGDVPDRRLSDVPNRRLSDVPPTRRLGDV